MPITTREKQNSAKARAIKLKKSLLQNINKTSIPIEIENPIVDVPLAKT